MAGECFQSLTLEEFLQRVDLLHTRVANGYGRVEVTRKGCDDVCVLISKAELQSLERALEIFAEGAEYRRMSQTVASVCATRNLGAASA